MPFRQRRDENFSQPKLQEQIMQLSERIPALPNKSLFAMNRWFYKMQQAGLLFHPDDCAEDIVEINSGLPTFTEAECLKVNQAISRMFECHGDKVYEVALKYVHQAMGMRPDFSVE
jgi:hypothetical protein